MSHKQAPEWKIPIGDIIGVLRKNKLKILSGALFFAAVLTLFALLRPIRYESLATFREKSHRQPSISPFSFASLVLTGTSATGKSEAITMMRSRKLLQQVAKRLNLQADLKSSQQTSPAIVQRMLGNLLVEYNWLFDRDEYPLADPDSSIRVTEIEYPGIFPLSLHLIVEGNSCYRLFNESNHLLGSGRFGVPFSTSEFSVTLNHPIDKPLKAKTYLLTLEPLDSVTERLKLHIGISPDSEDPSFLKLSYRNRNRFVACNVINQLMYVYQKHLKNEQTRISKEQIKYLNRREEEISKQLDAIIDAYAATLSSDASASGYTQSEKAIEFLTAQLQQFRKRALLVDLDLRRLKKALDDAPETQMNTYFRTASNPKFMGKNIEELCRLKQASDGIQLAVRNTASEHIDHLKNTFAKQVAEIENVRQVLRDTRHIIAQLDNQQPFSLSEVMNTSQYLIPGWSKELQRLEVRCEQSPSPEMRRYHLQELDHFKQQFSLYLNNLAHYLQVKEKTLQERLSHQQGPQTEFQGINLEASENLYISYNKSLSDTESKILQHNFLLEELNNPRFELSSVSSVISDSVTSELVNSAAKLALALEDEGNRSDIEKNRIQDELQMKRRFLTLHLNQTVELLRLRANLIKEKIAALQNAMLELISQRIAILEKQLSDSIRIEIENLGEEKELIAENQSALQAELAAIPKKWAAEKMMENQLKMKTAMVEEVSKLVESKNIAANLEFVQSSPVDVAIAAVKPLSPHLILFSSLGALLGILLTSFGLIAQGIAFGFPISKEFLEQGGFHVSGSLTKKDRRDSLRRLAAFINGKMRGKEKPASSLLLVINKQNTLPSEIATVLQKQGRRILVVDQISKTKGLIEYLDGELDALPVEKNDLYDRVPFGGKAEYELEKLASSKFSSLFAVLEEKYDWIIVAAQASVLEIEVEHLLGIVDYAAIVVSKNNITQQSPLFRFIEITQKKGHVTFLLDEN